MNDNESSKSLFSQDIKKEDDYDDVTRTLGEEMMRIDQEAEKILFSIRIEERLLQQNSTISQYSNCNGDSDSDDDASVFDPNDIDDETDDEIHEEILNLGTVTANLRQDLDEVGVECLETHFSECYSGDSYRYSSHSVAFQAASPFLRDRKICVPALLGEGRTTLLLATTIAIWSVSIILLVVIQHGDAIIEKVGDFVEYFLPSSVLSPS
jgi:hypothetical protein